MTQAAASPQNAPRSETYAPHDWKAEDFASEKYRAVNNPQLRAVAPDPSNAGGHPARRNRRW